MKEYPRHINPPVPGETALQTINRLEANLYNLTGAAAAERQAWEGELAGMQEAIAQRDADLEKTRLVAQTVPAAISPVLPTGGWFATVKHMVKRILK